MSDRDLLAHLEDLANRLGIKVLTQDFFEEEFRIQSGSCTIKNQRVVVVDKRLSTVKKTDVLIEELKRHNLDRIYIPPFLRSILEDPKRATDPTPPPQIELIP